MEKINLKTVPPLPSSWSSLAWQELCRVWTVKVRYGGQPDIAICAALLDLCGLTVAGRDKADEHSGEEVYLLTDKDGRQWRTTPRELAHAARQAIPWFDYPYGDPGQDEKKDDKGKVVQERREPHHGYVGPLRDALMLQDETVSVSGNKVSTRRSRRWFKSLCGRTIVFALPQVACNNLTWSQYRALQPIASQLWQDGITDEQALDLQAQFMAQILVPRSLALLDTSGDTIRLCPHYTFKYSSEQADSLVGYWKKKLSKGGMEITTLFHICHQVWQTALVYYSKAYPMLFEGGGKQGPMNDALQGEVGTVNTIMKYSGYSEQQQVYDSNLPFVLDILNTMTKEAKEIEAMNAKIKHK